MVQRNAVADYDVGERVVVLRHLRDYQVRKVCGSNRGIHFRQVAPDALVCAFYREIFFHAHQPVAETIEVKFVGVGESGDLGLLDQGVVFHSGFK